MRGLDTGILVDLLRGRRTFRSLSQDPFAEFATTEINLFELEMIAASGHRAGLDRRLASLDRLRRKLTVISVDGRSPRAAAETLRKGRGALTPLEALMLAAAATAGCSEWLAPAPLGVSSLRAMKVRVLPRRAPKDA